MNISANPWTFVPADVQTETVTSITLNADGTVTLVGSANTAGMVQGAPITIIGATPTVYNGFYEIISVTNATTLVLAPQINSVLPGYVGRIPVGTGAAGAAGTVGLCNYVNQVRVEDISWQSSGAPFPVSSLTAADVLAITDRAGNPIWSAVQPATVTSPQNRGKIFWVQGITFFAMTHGIVLMTVD